MPCADQPSCVPRRGRRGSGSQPSSGGAVRITIDSVQSAGNAQADCASLAGGAATVNEDDSVELAFELEQNDRGVDLTLQQLGREVLFQGATIDGPLAGARNQANTGDGFLTTTGA
mgnify:FL=1